MVNCFGPCCSTLIRFIIFGGCLALVLFQVHSFLFIFSLEGITVPASLKSIPIYLQVLAVLVISAYGCYAAVYRRRSDLNNFVSLSLFCIIILIFLCYFNCSTEARAMENEDFVELLKEYSKNYNWSGLGTRNVDIDQQTSKEVTVLMDKIQYGLQCCGVYSRGDWNNLRPFGVDNNMFPSSCCRNPVATTPQGSNLCPLESIWPEERGCLNRIIHFDVYHLIGYIVSISGQFLFALLAFLLALGTKREEEIVSISTMRLESPL